MEIKLNLGDKINVPAGYKAIIKENTIVIEEEQKQEEFKDGDILLSKTTNTVLIFSNYSKDDKSLFDSYFNNAGNINCSWNPKNFRHATEEETQALFDELKARGLQWNAETKQMERIGCKVKLNEPYLYISRNGEICKAKEKAFAFDDNNYNSGNYYLPSEREDAEEDAKAIRTVFEKRLKSRIK